MTADVRILREIGFPPNQARHLGYDGGWVIVDEAWIPFSENVISGRATQILIDVPTDATTRFQIGDKIKFIQDGTAHYEVLITIAATRLTMVGDTGLSANPITAVYVSREEAPFGFPETFSWTPNISVDAGSCTNVVVQLGIYRPLGGALYYYSMRVDWHQAVAAATQVNLTLPMLTGNSQPQSGFAENAQYFLCRASSRSVTDDVKLERYDMAAGAWIVDAVNKHHAFASGIVRMG